MRSAAGGGGGTPYCPPCYVWSKSLGDCVYNCKGPCESCITGVGCSYKCDLTNCQGCVGGECKLCAGDPNLACCNGSCYDYRTHGCCNGETVYNKATQKCCSGTNGDFVCAKDKQCCGNGNCCDTANCKSCVDGQCQSNCDPNMCQECIEGFCIPCEFLGKVCCNGRCEQPCKITTNCTSCAKSQEEDYACPGCLVFPGGGGCLGHTYREYTGVVIYECEGCRSDTNSVPCYYERRCIDKSFEAAALCMVLGSGRLGCVPDYGPEGEDGTPVVGCLECGTEGQIIYTYRRDTCTACYDN